MSFELLRTDYEDAAFEGLRKDAAARAMISDEYNSAETYAKGNLCIYNGKIYEAIKETTGTWDATAWEETTLAKVNGKLNGDIASLTEKKLEKSLFQKKTITSATPGWVATGMPTGAVRLFAYTLSTIDVLPVINHLRGQFRFIFPRRYTIQ